MSNLRMLDLPPPVLLVANQKGGVGKTTLAVALSIAVAESGLRVLLVDFDPQGSATWVLRRLDDDDTGAMRADSEEGSGSKTLDERIVDALLRDRPLRSGYHLLRPDRGTYPDELRLLPAGPALAMIESALHQSSNSYLLQQEIPGIVADPAWAKATPAGNLPDYQFSSVAQALLQRRITAVLGNPEQGFSMRRSLRQESMADFDLIIIDSPPTYTWLLEEAIDAASDILVVATPDRSGLRGVHQLITQYTRNVAATGATKEIVGVLMNRCRGTRDEQALIQGLGERYPGWLLPMQIPDDRAVRTLFQQRRFTLFSRASKRRSPAWTAIEDLCTLVTSRLSEP